MKNILIIVPKLAGGGAERAASNLSFMLSKNYNVIILTINNIVEYPYAGKLISLNSQHSDNLIVKFINIFKRAYKIRKIKRSEKIDYSISLLESANITNIFSRDKDKVIVTFRDYMSKNLKNLGIFGKIQKIFIKYFYNYADSIVSLTNIMKHDLITNFGIKKEKIKVIYNSYEIEKIDEFTKKSTSEFEKVFDSPVIINTGRLSKQKAQWNLIRAFKHVKSKVPNIKLVILGDGELKDYLINLSCDLDLKTYSIWDNNQDLTNDYDVYFFGFQKNPFNLIAKSSVFVLSSLWEGFPNALVEAMACKVPVIAADCSSGPREILAPNTDCSIIAQKNELAEYGVLMPVFDFDEGFYSAQKSLTKTEQIWADYIADFVKNRDLCDRYAELAFKRASDFRTDKIFEDWRNFLKT